MYRLRLLPALGLVLAMVLAGCSGGSNPLSPDPDTIPPYDDSGHRSQSSTCLWGYYNVYIDVENWTATAALARHGMFTTNVVNFLNENPLSMSFEILEIVPGSGYIDIDIDVMLRHPFPGMDKFDGYDVRGVFMGDGSASLAWNSELIYPVLGTDQSMFADPDDPVEGNGAPDGYTRWFNLPEFSSGDMPLFLYTQGKLAHPAFAGTATLCPYKYFADGLGPNKDLWGYLDSPANHHGEFTSGADSTRNFYLRFPDDKGTMFGYAVLANWFGPDPEDHPSNAPETIGCDVTDNSSVYYVDPSNNGGSLNFDISLWDWGVESAGVGDYAITVESTVLSLPYTLDSGEMTPVGSDENYSTYQVEIPADSVLSTIGQEYWVIVEYANFDYSNEFGVTNDAWDDPLCAYFRYNLPVSGDATNADPICDLELDPDSPDMPFTGWGAFIFDASGSYDPNPGDVLTFEWDFDNDGVFGDYYNYGTPEKPVMVFDFINQEQVCVRLSDGNGGEAVCCLPVDISGVPSKNIPLRDGVIPTDIAVDPSDGDLLIHYDDAQVWKRVATDFYETGNLFVTTWSELSHIDINDQGWFLTAGFRPSLQRPMGIFWDMNGASPQYWNFEWGPYGFVSDEYRFLDVVAFGPNGTHLHDIGPVTGAPYQGNHQVRFLNLNDTNNFHSWTRYIHSHTGSDHIGFDKLYYDYVEGAETDRDGDFIWFVENTDFYATRWSISPPIHNGTGTFVYDGVNFGTGVQTDDDDGWNDARDITRDNQNRYFVLDELSTGEPRIKAWSVDGATPTSLGGFGDPVTVEGPPLRIEGSDFNGNVFILHGDETDGFKLSVFLPGEMPG